jgi:F-type H+-transporting ATPase subunit delta
MTPAIRGYAAALFEVARAEGALDQVEDELFRFARTVEQSTKLREALHDISLPAEHRASMVAELLGQKASPHTVNLIAFIVASGRVRELSSIVDALVEKAAAERAKALAEVRAAVPLGPEEREKLTAAIRRATGKAVEIKVLVDPSVIGGLLIRVGDQVFDGTVRRRLQLAKERLESAARG